MQNLEMAAILGKSESILSIFSKYQLVAAGLSDVMDIGAMTGADAISVASGYQKVKDAATAVVSETAIGKLVAARVKNQGKLNDIVKAAAKQDKSYYDDAIKKNQKLIDALEEERKKRLEVLELQERSQSFETSIKQAQIKYQEALASGNMAQAAQEQLNIQKIRSDRERELARKSINDKFDAERKKLEDEIEKLQNQKDAQSKAASNAVTGAARATEDTQSAKEFESKVIAIISKYGGKFTPDAQKALAVAFKNAKDSKDKGLAAAATTMEKEYITGSKTYQGSPGTGSVTVTKDKYQSMFENLSLSALAKAESNDKFETAVEDFVDAVNIFKGKAVPSVTTSGRTTGQNRYQGAVDPMGKPGGTIEKIGGVTYIYDNMGKRYDISTTAGKALKKAFGKDKGGYISGPGTSTSDSIPAMLSDGEYVIKASSVDKAQKEFGSDFFDTINAGRFAEGGLIQKFGKGGTPNPFGMGMEWFGKTLSNAGNSVIKNLLGFDITTPFNKKSKMELLSMALLPVGGGGMGGAKIAGQSVAKLTAKEVSSHMAAIDKAALEKIGKHANHGWEEIQQMRVAELSKKYKDLEKLDVKKFNEIYAKEFYGLSPEQSMAIYKGDTVTAAHAKQTWSPDHSSYFSRVPDVAAPYSDYLRVAKGGQQSILSSELKIASLTNKLGEARSMAAGQGMGEFPVKINSENFAEMMSKLTSHSSDEFAELMKYPKTGFTKGKYALDPTLGYSTAFGFANGGYVPKFENGINMVPADMLAMLHKNESVVPANMNPFNPNANKYNTSSSSLYNINVTLNGTDMSADDVANAIERKMRIREATIGRGRNN
jgi:hypothetical protein